MFVALCESVAYRGMLALTIGLSKIAVAILVCGLMPLAGCSRTSDGTVVMPVKPLTVPSFRVPKLMPRFGRAEPATQFPPELANPKASRKARYKPVRRISVTQAACLEQNPSGERVRVVCG